MTNIPEPVPAKVISAIIGHDPLGPLGFHAFMASFVYHPSVWVRLGSEKVWADSSWVRKGLGPSRPRNFGSESELSDILIGWQ